MDNHNAEAIRKHVRTYLGVFVALLVGTLITVGVAQVDLGRGNIAVALIIAAIEAALVGAFFMHLVSEKKMIYTIMAFTVVFFVALMLLTVLSMGDVIINRNVS